MSRVYQTTCKNGIVIGLFKRIQKSDFPYVIKRNGFIVSEIESLGDDNREYHKCVRENSPVPF